MSRERNQRHRQRRIDLLAVVFAACLFSLPAFAQDAPKVGESGLPLPRWASLKSAHVNARSGPGDTYPVKAVYKRSGLPVEIVAEFKLWREIVDIEGEHNWVHKALLSGTRHAILKEDAYAYSGTSGSNAVAKLQKGAQVRIDECKNGYCRMNVDEGLTNLRGWVEKSKLWGVYPDENFD